MTEYQRRRSILACDMCRLRKIKCDSRQPQCGPCELIGAECIYRAVPGARPSRLEVDISEIRQRLDQITALLTSDRHMEENQPVHHATPSPRPAIGISETGHVSLADRDGVYIEFPFMIIQRRSMMRLLDLDLELARWLINMERAIAGYPALVGTTPGFSTSRLLMMQSHRLTADLASFSEHVHTWYPLFSVEFSDIFFYTIGNVGSSTVNSCLAILVLAIGCMAGNGNAAVPLDRRPELVYIHEATSFLQNVFLEHSIPALQCLVLFAIYHLHLLQPCQAHDYILAASSRVQNMLRSHQYPPNSDSGELLGRAYWTILLIESELLIQLDLPQSGIWAFNDSVPLPSASTVWHFPLRPTQTDTATLRSSSHFSSIPSNAPADNTLVYFVAEIAMRRMLQRCTTSVRRSAGGGLRYAPVIATELELHLHEWYDYLPPLLRFPKSLDDRDHGALHPNAQFLQAQFFACKASIYWPAVYQSIELGEISDELSQYCAKYFKAYIAFISAAASTLKSCRVNSWTLATSIFIITMAALRAIILPSFDKEFNSDELRNSFTRAIQVITDISPHSPSLAALGHILDERVAVMRKETAGHSDHSILSYRKRGSSNGNSRKNCHTIP
ncbi:hypothetical protein QWA68_015345 [Fusarium oxysporum]|nr:hypothetical protein QWA68_015345 [Fusarium oxysporum]